MTAPAEHKDWSSEKVLAALEHQKSQQRALRLAAERVMLVAVDTVPVDKSLDRRHLEDVVRAFVPVDATTAQLAFGLPFRTRQIRIDPSYPRQEPFPSLRFQLNPEHADAESIAQLVAEGEVVNIPGRDEPLTRGAVASHVAEVLLTAGAHREQILANA